MNPEARSTRLSGLQLESYGAIPVVHLQFDANNNNNTNNNLLEYIKPVTPDV